MLQADPLAGPGNQSLDRYSYVINNPLALTDRTGYSWLHNLDRIAGWITFGPLFPSVRNDYYAALANPYVRMAGAIVAAYFTFGGASALLADAGWSSTAAAAGASAAAGFASGAIETGTVQGGLYGAFSAELFFGISSAFNSASWAHAGGTIGPTDLNAVGFTAKVLAHGIAGGALSSLQGGKFGDGFIGAGVSEALSPAVSSLHGEGGRVAVAAIIGGTASRLSGGKFTNGAFSAAFGQLFNDEVHPYSTDGGGYRRYDSSDPNYHSYYVLSLICNTSEQYGCSASYVFSEGLDRYPAPFLSGDYVSNYELTSLPIFGSVRFQVFSADMEIINETEPGHLLAPGYVDRRVIQAGDDVYIQTYGEGTGNFSYMNAAASSLLWHAVDAQIARSLVLYPQTEIVP